MIKSLRRGALLGEDPPMMTSQDLTACVTSYAQRISEWHIPPMTKTISREPLLRSSWELGLCFWRALRKRRDTTEEERHEREEIRGWRGLANVAFTRPFVLSCCCPLRGVWRAKLVHTSESGG